MPEGYLEAMRVSDLAEGEMRRVELNGRALLIARAEGDFYASEANCPHMRGPLQQGKLNGTVVECPWHGSQFDIRDGRFLRWTQWTGALKTMADFVRHPRPLRVYETRVEDGILYVGPQKSAPDAETA